jgi:sulfur carrier protein
MVESLCGVNLVKLILRNKEYEVKPGMTLLSALQKIDVVPESVIATREGEMILDDEILKDGEVIKLIAVISGGACHCEGDALPKGPEAISPLNRRLLRHSVPRNDRYKL